MAQVQNYLSQSVGQDLFKFDCSVLVKSLAFQQSVILFQDSKFLVDFRQVSPVSCKDEGFTFDFIFSMQEFFFGEQFRISEGLNTSIMAKLKQNQKFNIILKLKRFNMTPSLS